MTVQQAARLAEVLAEALQYVHQQGYLHFDLKPSAVLLATDGTPKLADFGVAKKLQANELEPEGRVHGTPSYLAPEVARGEFRAVGLPSDIYALGAMLYEMLTGHPPFRGATALDTIMLHGVGQAAGITEGVTAEGARRNGIHLPEVSSFRTRSGDIPVPMLWPMTCSDSWPVSTSLTCRSVSGNAAVRWTLRLLRGPKSRS